MCVHNACQLNGIYVYDFFSPVCGGDNINGGRHSTWIVMIYNAIQDNAICEQVAHIYLLSCLRDRCASVILLTSVAQQCIK